jgi:heat shock 70kDa protein 4
MGEISTTSSSGTSPKSSRQKYKVDVLSSPKATFRLAAGCEEAEEGAERECGGDAEPGEPDERHRRVVEDDQGDVRGAHRVHPRPGRAHHPGGGSTRIPAVRAKIQSVFPTKALSTTLNQDEAVARGATFSCAMLSPTFRVRDFHMVDVNNYPIKVQWAKAEGDEDTELEVFGHGNSVPSTEVLSFARQESFDIEVVYKDPVGLPGQVGCHSSFAHFFFTDSYIVRVGPTVHWPSYRRARPLAQGGPCQGQDEAE